MIIKYICQFVPGILCLVYCVKSPRRENEGLILQHAYLSPFGEKDDDSRKVKDRRRCDVTDGIAATQRTTSNDRAKKKRGAVTLKEVVKEVYWTP